MVAVVISIMSDLTALIVSGLCGMIIWNWFIPTCFASVPNISFVSSMGIILIASAFVSSGKTYDFEEINNNPDVFAWNCVFNQLAQGVMKPIFLLCFAWAIHTFLV